MDSISDEKDTEEQNSTFVLPNDVSSHILPRLPQMDIHNATVESRSFYNIIRENYHLSDGEKLHGFSITHGKNERYPFLLHMTFKSVSGEDSRVNIHDHEKVINIESVGQLTAFLRMFDMKSLDHLYVLGADNLDIFSVLEELFEIGSNIRDLHISKLEEKDFASFRIFIDKFSSIKWLAIYDICASSKGTEYVNSLLSLSSFSTIKSFTIRESPGTKILSADMVINIFRKNPNMMSLGIGSWNIEFLKNLFKKFFTMDQTRKKEDECNYCEIHLNLFYEGEFKRLHDILRSDLSDLENVEEVAMPYSGSALFESVMDCKYCLRNKHKIKRCIMM
uniref:F-box domain-containing protein n=1 Tax=Strongyloides papillosus TaxID=174720 RepID=A0A0N5CIH5_STREA